MSAIKYYYPPEILGWDFFTVFAFAFVEYCRLSLASKGNKMAAILSETNALKAIADGVAKKGF